ncbi:MAG: ABC transporter substrate-binding protein [Desulfamplus sp.]|nr:ABC transporter substrate-binding protein [Desulfamplus sp.]
MANISPLTQMANINPLKQMANISPLTQMTNINPLKQIADINRLKQTLMFIMSLLLILILSCSRNEPPVHIGAALVLTGPAAFVGEEIRDGLAMAVEEINGRGGINGRRIELLIEDANAPSNSNTSNDTSNSTSNNTSNSSTSNSTSDEKSMDGKPMVPAHENPVQNDPAQKDPAHEDPAHEDPAQKAFETLDRKNPLVILTSLSFLSVKLAPLAEAKKRLMVGLVASAPELTQNNRQWVYRYWITAEHEAPSMVDMFQQLHNTKGKLGVIYLDDAYGGSVYKDLEKRCASFSTTVSPAPFHVSQKIFSREVELVKHTSAVAIVGFDGHIINVLKALREIGYKGEIISTTTATLPSVTAIPEASGVYVTAPAIYNKNFHFIDQIKARYEKKFGKPFTQYSANGYDFIYIVSGLLEDQPITQESLKSLLENGFVYSGVFGNVELKKGKKDILFPLFPAQILNGSIIYK